MAKCRNCKKDIDATATRCPYCLTEMPTSNIIANIKGTFITLVLFGIFGLSMYFFVTSLMSKLGLVLGLIIMFVFFLFAVVAGIAAIGCFTNAKKWSEEDTLNSVRSYILFGLVCALISITLFVVGFMLAVSVMV